MVQWYTSLQDIIKIRFELGNMNCPGLSFFRNDGKAVLARSRHDGGGSMPICPRFETSDRFLFHHADQVAHPKFGATFDARVMSMLGHDMLAIEVIRNQLVDLRDLVEIILRFDALPFGGVGDTGERALPPHQNFVWGQTAFSYPIMQVKQGPR